MLGLLDRHDPKPSLVERPMAGRYDGAGIERIVEPLAVPTPRKASTFGEAPTAVAPKQGEQGPPVAESCRKAGLDQATQVDRKKRREGPTPPEMRRPKQIVRTAPESSRGVRTVDESRDGVR